MDVNALIDRVKGVLLKTEEEWGKIRKESVTFRELFIPYIAALAAIPAISSFLGEIFFPRYRYIPWRGIVKYNVVGTAFFSMVYSYIITFAVIFVLGLAVNELSTIFDSKKDLNLSMKLSVYSFTPFCLISVFFIFPGLYWFIILLSLYGMYIFYLGIEILLEAPNEKRVAFTIAVGLIYFFAINLFFLLGRGMYF